jgi:hypothetical protein
MGNYGHRRGPGEVIDHMGLHKPALNKADWPEV